MFGYINGDEWSEKEWEYHNEEWDIEREIGTYPKKPDSNYLKKFPNDPKVKIENQLDRFGGSGIIFLVIILLIYGLRGVCLVEKNIQF